MDVVALDPFAGKGHHSMPLHRQVDLFTLLLEQLIDQAIMLVDDCGDLLWANSNARSMQDRWEIYQFLSSGRVFFDDQLKRVLLASGSYSSSEPLQQNFIKADYSFAVSAYRMPGKAFGHTYIWALLIEGKLIDPDKSLLAQLAPAEYRLLKKLEALGSLKLAASALGISYENARTTLKRVFYKLNVHSQRELLAKTRGD